MTKLQWRGSFASRWSTDQTATRNAGKKYAWPDRARVVQLVGQGHAEDRFGFLLEPLEVALFPRSPRLLLLFGGDHRVAQAVDHLGDVVAEARPDFGQDRLSAAALRPVNGDTRSGA